MVACLHYDAQALGVRNGRQLGRAALGRYGAGSWRRSRPKSGSSGLAWYCEALHPAKRSRYNNKGAL